jgi:hypothetical protein
MKNEHETFLQTADEALITAVRSMCRKRFPKTVAALDGLSALEWETIRAGGLLSLPAAKIKEIRAGMRADEFVWSS